MTRAFADRVRAQLATRERAARVPGPLMQAAVLAALFAREPDDEPHVWLLRRAERLRLHRGEVALPGGKRDPADPTAVDTALREAEEEIGLPRAQVEVLGALDDLVTITGFVVTPIVAWITAPFEPRPAPGEVARVFAAPVATFERGAVTRSVARGALERLVLAYDVDGETVWGATAAILRGLGEVTRPLRQ